MGETIEALTLDRKHHTIYTLGMIYCETMLKGKGSYNNALKIVEHLGKHLTEPIHEITPQPLESSPTRSWASAIK
ncbi:hypothetical protein ACU680_17485 [Pseudomonas koreensis]